MIQNYYIFLEHMGQLETTCQRKISGTWGKWSSWTTADKVGQSGARCYRQRFSLYKRL